MLWSSTIWRMVIQACSSGILLMGPLTTTIRLMTPRKNETNNTYEGSTITCIVPPRVAFVSHPQPLLRESIQIPPAHKTKRSLKCRDPQVVWRHGILHPRMGKILFAKVTRWVSICYCAISKYDINIYARIPYRHLSPWEHDHPHSRPWSAFALFFSVTEKNGCRFGLESKPTLGNQYLDLYVVSSATLFSQTVYWREICDPLQHNRFYSRYKPTGLITNWAHTASRF